LKKKLKVLRLELITDYTTAPYNNFTLPTKKKYDVQTISFNSNLKLEDDSFFNSEGSITSFIRLLNQNINRQNFDVIHIHSVHCGIFFLLNEILNFRFKNFRKSILTIHNSIENYSFRNLILFYINSFLVNKLVFCSKSSFNSFPFWIRNSKKSYVIQNGISIKKKNIKNRSIDFIYVGRLINIKNIELTLKFFKNIKGNCHIIGDGPLKVLVTDFCKKYNHIHYHGKLPRDSVYKYFSKSNYFVSLSKTEGLPITLLESIILGCNPIVSNIDPHKEILGEDFSLVDLNSDVGLANILNSPKDFNLPQSKRKSIIDMFSSERMLESYHNLYTSL